MAKITAKINAASGNKRTTANVIKTYQNIRRNVKATAAHNHKERTKTGGGKAKLKDLTDTQEKFLAAIPKESIEGIPNGYDTFDHRSAKGTFRLS